MKITIKNSHNIVFINDGSGNEKNQLKLGHELNSSGNEKLGLN